MTTELVVTRREPAQLDLTPERTELIKRTICQGATDDELELFIGVCKRTGLDPFARQIFAVKRWDANAGREVMACQVSIDGFRLIAERSGKYAGQIGPQWCGKDGVWTDVWLSSDAPMAARCGVLRSDFKEALWSVANWESYAQRKKDRSLTSMWVKFGPLMIAKCAEALALRRAFPQDLSGLYTAEEMQQESTVEPSTPAPAVEKTKALPATDAPTKVKLAQAISDFAKIAIKSPDFKGAANKIIGIALNGKNTGQAVTEEEAVEVLAWVNKCVELGFTFEAVYAGEVKP